MKKIFKIIVTIVFVVSYLPLHAQSLMELGMLDGLQNGLGQQNTQQNIIEDQETDKEEGSLKKEKPLQDLIDEDYSYSGDNSFAKEQKPNIKLQDKELQYFGYDFFSDVPSTFAQLKNTPIPSDYIIVPGDIINISLFGNENRQNRIKVSRNGDIFFPEIGPIYVTGLTLSETKKLLQNKITSQKLGTEVNVTLESFGSINIFVLGEAFEPGMFTVSSLTTITNAVLTSGGVKKGGSLRNIQLKRNGEVVSTFDFYDLILNGDTSNDQRLMTGDVVFIPPVNKTVAIQGEVSKPGIYELIENEDINDLIEIAGNLKPKADSIALEVFRVDKPNNGFSLFKINLDDTDSKKDLYNGDLIKVYPVLNNIKNAVLLTGHIEQPGFYPWYEGLRIGDIVTSDKLLTMTDLQYVLIKREDQKTQRYTFLQTDLEQVFLNKEKETESNIKLNERDEILFLPSLLRPEQIKTTMLQDKFKLDENNQMVMEDEWKSLTYLRKSIMEEKVKIEEANPYLNQEQQNTSVIGDEIGRYYEYSIYDYCTLPESVAIQVTEASGFRVKKSINIEELDNIDKPEDVVALKMEIENERVQNMNISEVEVAFNITNLCRKQLIDPLLDVITRQNSMGTQKGSVSVYGNVHFPGEYPLTEDMILVDVISAGGGMKDSTYDSEIELRRKDVSGKNFTTTTDTFTVLNDKQVMNISLKEMDLINLKQISNKIQTVEIVGEVFFEGVYPISTNQTLSQLISRAGGLKEFASLEGAYFQRASLKKTEMERLRSAKNDLKRKIVLTSQGSGGIGRESLSSDALNQLTKLVSDTSDEEVLGRLVVDLDSMLKGTAIDINLEDGDRLFIPKRKQTISVIGEVYVPNAHIYQENIAINDYIDLSGGVNAFADPSNVYIIKLDGSIVPPSKINNGGFFRASSSLQPGDTIVIPLMISPFNSMQATTEITQIIYQMAIAAAAVNSF